MGGKANSKLCALLKGAGMSQFKPRVWQYQPNGANLFIFLRKLKVCIFRYETHNF